jgi:hypothetical protein
MKRSGGFVTINAAVMARAMSGGSNNSGLVVDGRGSEQGSGSGGAPSIVPAMGYIDNVRNGLVWNGQQDLQPEVYAYYAALFTESPVCIIVEDKDVALVGSTLKSLASAADDQTSIIAVSAKSHRANVQKAFKEARGNRKKIVCVCCPALASFLEACAAPTTTGFRTLMHVAPIGGKTDLDKRMTLAGHDINSSNCSNIFIYPKNQISRPKLGPFEVNARVLPKLQQRTACARKLFLATQEYATKRTAAGPRFDGGGDDGDGGESSGASHSGTAQAQAAKLEAMRNKLKILISVPLLLQSNATDPSTGSGPTAGAVAGSGSTTKEMRAKMELLGMIHVHSGTIIHDQADAGRALAITKVSFIIINNISNFFDSSIFFLSDNPM